MGVWIETHPCLEKAYQVSVTPCMGVWIETPESRVHGWKAGVTPCMGVWIETCCVASSTR